MKTVVKVYLILFCLLLVSCEKIIMHPKPDTDNLSIYNEYAKLCTEKFGLEEVKGINLTALTDSIRPFINDNLSEQELFDYMGLLVDRMQEGHTQLASIDFKLNKSYYWFLGYPMGMNNSLVKKNYYDTEANPDVQKIVPENSVFEILYGFLPQDNEIGYISIISFNMIVSDSELEEMMEYLKDAKGLIIDVRSNIGGYIELASRLSSYFTNTEVTIGTNYIKNGPDKEDFAGSKMTIKPNGSPYTYTKPVMVLQDRVSFSSGSLFCIMMSAMENTTTVGIKFGGGTGDIMDGFLANGWKWSISTSNLIDSEGRPTDPGLDADIPMEINPTDTIVDAIIEKAILELQ